MIQARKEEKRQKREILSVCLVLKERKGWGGSQGGNVTRGE